MAIFEPISVDGSDSRPRPVTNAVSKPREIRHNSSGAGGAVVVLLLAIGIYVNLQDKISKLEEKVKLCSLSIENANYSINKQNALLSDLQLEENSAQFFQLRMDLDSASPEELQPNPCLPTN